MSDSYFLDANVLVRLLTGDDESRARRVAAFLSASSETGVRLALTPATLSEVVFVLLGEVYRYGRADVALAVEAVLALPLVVTDRSAVERAVELFRDYHPGWADCLLAAYALEQTEGRVVSFDRGLDRIPGLSRIEPPMVSTA